MENSTRNLAVQALNHFAAQGWVVKAVMTPPIKGFSGVVEQTIVVVLER